MGRVAQAASARVRVSEVVDGLNQLADRLAAGEAFGMDAYDLAVVEVHIVNIVALISAHQMCRSISVVHDVFITTSHPYGCVYN